MVAMVASVSWGSYEGWQSAGAGTYLVGGGGVRGVFMLEINNN
jgi:hypothetical protein